MSKGFIDDHVAKQVEALKKLPATTQKNYFEVDPNTGQYIRRFAHVMEIDTDHLILRIDSEDWVIPSGYDLLDLVDGDWILGVAYPGFNGLKKFYPLGPDNQFLVARDARNAYLPSDVADVNDSTEVQAARAQQNDLKVEFLRLAEQVAGVHASTTEFGQALGQIIQNATSVADMVGSTVAAAKVTDTGISHKGRTPVSIRSRDVASDVDEKTKDRNNRGRGIKRVRSHFRGQK